MLNLPAFGRFFYVCPITLPMSVLTPFIDEKFDGQVWKFVIDGRAGLLLAEIRNTGGREVSFASINLNTGKLNFTGLNLPEKWLIGLEGSFEGTLLLHGFQSAQSPVRKGIYAFDGETGLPLWSNYNDVISQLTINGPAAYNTQVHPPVFYLLDSKTGATLRPYNPSVDTEIVQDITLPTILTSMPSDLNISFDGEPTGNCHYMEHNGFRIVSLHTLNQGILKQQLLVMFDGKPVYEDILTDEIQKLQPEAFIRYKNHLIYIKNTRELKILNL
ncbi:hypothetical protein BEL04_01185 [Mucilaginibacter sp. PPCGB 2223]|uniref:DUF4905 domain-containing protein n=1 Tax=Mucilaginibacter sp. PPCGB 2223 TaxID=1886027 RepID=UPI000826010E|nr:DUF4905 domain-containing protein [Mucilaginibacter sp. PPCGB 2223]OCX52970.1 hypothetical protein BEL04_01185 [Mucilaginibacter sp. PPCGB 2223]